METPAPPALADERIGKEASAGIFPACVIFLSKFSHRKSEALREQTAFSHWQLANPDVR